MSDWPNFPGKVVCDLSKEYGISTGASSTANKTALQTCFNEYATRWAGIPLYLPPAVDQYPMDAGLLLPSYPLTWYGDGPNLACFKFAASSGANALSYTNTVGTPTTAGQPFTTNGGSNTRGIYKMPKWRIIGLGFEGPDWTGSAMNGLNFPNWDTTAVPNANNRLVLELRDCIVCLFNGEGVINYINGNWPDTSWHGVISAFNAFQGFELGSDSRYIDCLAMNNGYEGFYVNGRNTQLVGCKSYGAGTLDKGRGRGFYYTGFSPGPGSDDLYAQDCMATGLFVESADKVTLSTFISDRNGVALQGMPMGDHVTVSFSIANPCVATTVAVHGMSVGQPIRFDTAGTLPSHISRNVLYYVTAVPTTTTFRFSATNGGADISTLGDSQSGVHFFSPFSGVEFKDCHDITIDGAIATDSSGFSRNNPMGVQVHAVKVWDSTGSASYNNRIEITQATTQGADSNIALMSSALDPLSDLKGTNLSLGGGESCNVFGDGADGFLVFDGTTTVAGLAPSASVYTLTRDLYAKSVFVFSGVTVKTAGYRVFALGVITNRGTIQNNGTTVVTQATAGGAGGLAGFFFGGTAGGAGGANAVGVQATAQTSSAGALGGAGTAGSTATNAGGAQRTVTAPTAAMGGTQSARNFHQMILGRLSTVVATPVWSVIEGGTGGGGGGSTGTTAKGGDGGGGGGVVFLCAREIYNQGTISANGGNGANGLNGNGTGGGGGGGGGGVVFCFYHRFSGNTPTATKGTTGTGGSAGTAGADGIVVQQVI